MEVTFLDDSTKRVRLLGVDAPERASPNKPYKFMDITDTACLDRWGLLAARFATETLDGQTVDLVQDPIVKQSSYGLELAHIYVDGEDFNAKLVALGLARVFTEKYGSQREDLFPSIRAGKKKKNFSEMPLSRVRR